MAYVALYRKWRPAVFEDVKGQDPIITTLRNQILSGRIAHAYLFCGSRGTGKTTVAKIFAKAVNCSNPADGHACGVCEVCRAIDAGSSMNVVEVDAASNNGVDYIREIRDEVQYSPTEGKYRVYIIDEAHMLSTGASNAFLKTLEEPPPYVIFILATTEPHKLPVTVLSRCQRYDFRRIGREDIEARLWELAKGEGLEIEEEAVQYIARKADGGLRDALSLLDQCVSFHMNEVLTYEKVLEALGTVDHEVFSRFLRAVLAQDATKALQCIEDLIMSGREISKFVQDFTWYMRNLLLLMTAKADKELLEMSLEDWQRLVQEGRMTSPEEVMRLIRLYSELLSRMRNATDKRVLLEIATIKATRPAMEKDIESLTARVASLERKLAEGIPAALPAKREEPACDEPKKIVPVSKAQWEDLQQIRREWKKILGGIERPASAALREAFLEPRGEGVMGIVISEPMDYNWLLRINATQQLEAYIEERMEKLVHFELRLAAAAEPAVQYVAEDEIRSVIHMEIEEED